jgi:hypothetical protein
MNFLPFEDWRQLIYAYLFFTPIYILMSVWIVVLASPLTLFLWNSLMPVLFGLKPLSWLQAVGLSLLARLLFTSR